jgi:2'-5' RNA ligase
MYAIISELDQDTAVHVMRLWRKLNDACGLEGIFNYPNPHFTWLGAASVQVEPVQDLFNSIAEQMYTFPVRITGLDVFRGEAPVLYLSLFQSYSLLNLHKVLWEKITPFIADPNPYYAPEKWTPHITLALHDLTNENLDCAIKSVEQESVRQVSWVDNMALVEADDGQLGETLCRVEFS